MGKKAKMLIGTLVLGGAIAYDMGRVYRTNEERGRRFYTSLELIEPPMGFLEAYKYQWGLRTNLGDIDEMDGRKISALKEKLESIGRGDSEKIGELVRLMKTKPPIRHYAADALGRIGTKDAQMTFYSLIMDRDFDWVMAEESVRQLRRLSPNLAVDALIRSGRCERGYAGESFSRLLGEIGGERSLTYLMDTKNVIGMNKLISEYAGSSVVRRHKQRLISIMVDLIVKCRKATNVLYAAGESIRLLDEDYAHLWATNGKSDICSDVYPNTRQLERDKSTIRSALTGR